MVDYTFTFSISEDDQIALTYWLEKVNADRATMYDADGNPLTQLDIQGLLFSQFQDMLRDYTNELRLSTEPLLQVCQTMTTNQKAMILSKLPDGCKKAWLRHKLSELA